MTGATAALSALLDRAATLDAVVAPRAHGFLTSYDGMVMEATGVAAPVGTICAIDTASGGTLDAEVIGFRAGRCILMSLGGAADVVPRARVAPTGADHLVAVGPGLFGRVIDGAGRPLDGRGLVRANARRPLKGSLQNPLDRASVTQVFDVGVRAINGLLTLGRGQRVGVVAGSGVGKSVLLGMMTRFAVADVVVVGLIGERSREVTDFLATKLAGDAMHRAVVVAVPANHSPLMRIQGVLRATAIAEAFRAEGKSVLLIVDSLTRVAHAQREIGLALGEQPTAKGYPPSAIALLPAIIERAGNDVASGGSITAIYTVLADGDDVVGDPIVDAARAILDGHIVLSRAQAERGVYPAIDIGASISRVMSDIVGKPHLAAARNAKRAHALYEQNRDLVLMGAYQAGQDASLDAAIAMQPLVAAYIGQDEHDRVGLSDSVAALAAGFDG